MGNLTSQVNGILSVMHTKQNVSKGVYGERAAFCICEEFYKNCGGILIHSYSYETDPMLQGNVKRGDNGKHFIANLGSYTEIDILYVSKYKVFPIEIKAYACREIRFDDEGIYGCRKTDKSPIHQNEMHCRHLYSHIFRAVPEGSTDYIVPIVCMVDATNIVDERTDWQKLYIKLCTLNQLHALIEEHNVPGQYLIDLQLMNQILKDVMVKHEKYLPPRC